MARTLNKVMLIGNVGNDPELKHTPSGIPVTNFRLATSENRKDKEGNNITHTDWHTIVAWRGLAEVVEKMVYRSSRVFVEGKIQTRNYEDKLGNHRRVVEILAEKILLLDGNKRNDSEIINNDTIETEVSENNNTEEKIVEKKVETEVVATETATNDFSINIEAENNTELFAEETNNGDIPF